MLARQLDLLHDAALVKASDDSPSQRQLLPSDHIGLLLKLATLVAMVMDVHEIRVPTTWIQLEVVWKLDTRSRAQFAAAIAVAGQLHRLCSGPARWQWWYGRLASRCANGVMSIRDFVTSRAG